MGPSQVLSHLRVLSPYGLILALFPNQEDRGIPTHRSRLIGISDSTTPTL